MLHSRVAIDDAGPFLRLGREIAGRYGWGSSNITQQDGFYVSPTSILGVELKLGAATSPNQLLKYITLMVCEEKLTGKHSALGMLYITPWIDPARVWGKCGAKNGKLPADFLDKCLELKLSLKLRRLVIGERDHFHDAAGRLNLAHLSWNELAESCRALIKSVGSQHHGDETVVRLFSGFVDAMREHGGTGLDPAAAEGSEGG